MLDVKLLGQFEIVQDGKRRPIPTRNAQSLFAYLALSAGKAHRREMLAGLLWPDSSEENARSNLRHELWRLRKAVESEGQSYFLIDDLTIAFDPKNEYSLDVHTFEGAPHAGATTAELTGELSAYTGELLPGFYDEWVLAERNRLAGLFEAKMAALLEILQSEERWAEVIKWGKRWISQGGWPEPAYRALMTAYASNGDVPKAAATYEHFAQALQKELGVKPSEQTLALYKRIKTGWKTDTRTRDRPQKALAAGQVPATVLLPRVRRSNLPEPLTSFIGREKEIQQVTQLVSRARLVTITGAGGVGKTRLAIQAAGMLAPQFRDGVWWVELGPLFETSPAKPQGSQKPALKPGEPEETNLVIQAVAKALRVPESHGLSDLEEVLEYLHDKKLLLVLDNCEHLIESCASLAGRLLGDCPDVTILSTSREALGLPGEKAWLLPSLSLPVGGKGIDFKEILQSEAVSLFNERTAEILPGYQPDETDLYTIAQICLRLDGIPLAIELAAARMHLLSAQEIAARLDSRFSLLTGGHRTALPRHQTLRAAIEWSYDLLEIAEQVLFRRLSIFPASFTLEAAEEICASEDICKEDVISLLGRLVDKSLLIVEPAPKNSNLMTRYRFLDTIYSFGHLKLDETDEAYALRNRHAAYYVRLVETAEPELLMHNQVFWYKILQAERDNLRAVIEWSNESDQAESALKLVGALLWFWFRSGSNREGRDLALQALGLPSAIRYKKARARALNTAGFLQCLLGDTTSARSSLEEAISIFKQLKNDEINLAWSHQFMGLVLTYDGKYDLADASFEEGLALVRKQKIKNANSFLYFLGDVDFQRGDRKRAKSKYEESVNIFRIIGNNTFLAYPLRRLGYLALEKNDFTTAQKYFLESLNLNYQNGDMPGLTASLNSLAVLAMRLNQTTNAVRLYGLVESRLESLSVNLLYTDQTEFGQLRSKLRSVLNEAVFDAFIEGWEMSEEQAMFFVGEVFKDEFTQKAGAR